MLVVEKRPRDLSWVHAGPLLFGDWGTSRLYVLGLAFYFTAHASPIYLAAMSVLMAGVAWCYTIICREFQEGGGVYAVARRINPTLAIFGATLLLCDYIVTASLSIVDGMHYFGVPHDSKPLTIGLCVAVIAFIGFLNWFGARRAGQFAMVVAVVALATSAIIGLLSFPFVKVGLENLSWGDASISSLGTRWTSFVGIVLALSGVEAVANMTGLMKQPVPKTARRTIWPVLLEVVLLNMIFGIALTGLSGLLTTMQPDVVTYEHLGQLSSDQVPVEVKEYRDTAVRVLAEHAGAHFGGAGLGRWLGIGSGIAFGMLLISATNTAIMAMVSVLYAMAHDRELPPGLTRLNSMGVPWMGLVAGCVAPVALLLVMSDVAQLADLYAVGVCGAVTISVMGCVINRKLAIGVWERRGMAVVGLTMLAIEATIIVTKWHATVFAAVVIGSVLVVRWIMLAMRKEQVEVPPTGWLAELRSSGKVPQATGPRIMLAARGRDQAEFAVDLAKRRGGMLFAIFVRPLRVIDPGPGMAPRIEDDPDALEALGTVLMLAKAQDVPFVPIYVVSPDIAAEVLDYTVTFGCDTLIMGKSRRTSFARAMGGDVVGEIASTIPEGVTLLTRAPGSSQPVEQIVMVKDEDDATPPQPGGPPGPHGI